MSDPDPDMGTRNRCSRPVTSLSSPDNSPANAGTQGRQLFFFGALLKKLHTSNGAVAEDNMWLYSSLFITIGAAIRSSPSTHE